MAFDITATWNTGDINTRVTSTCNVINDAGTLKILAPIQHGVKAFDVDGNLLWTYSSITNGYDVRHIAVGDLTGSGYNDCAVVCSGYYNTSTDGKVAILDPDGNALQLLKTSDFGGTAPSGSYYAYIDGTDIYISTNIGLHKFVKSGSTWSEAWNVGLGACKQIYVGDLGNGKRIIVDVTSVGLKCLQTDGTVVWTGGSNNQYQGVFAVGKTDSTITGNQIVVPCQSSGYVIDKDGNTVGTFTPNNVGGGVCVYDCDGDGEDEFYFSDMARDVYCYERTGTNTYSAKYTLSDVLNTSKYAGLAHFDINNDGDDEIFIFTTDGYCYIYDKTLSTLVKSLNIAHGVAGGYSLSTYQNLQNGIYFADTSGDGHSDLVISGSSGYVDVFECSGVIESGTDENSQRLIYAIAEEDIETERGLYAMGSQTLSTDYFNVTFSTGSTEARDERLLYSKAYLEDGSERGLYAIGNSSGESEKGLYAESKEDGNSEKLLNASAKDTDQSERQLYANAEENSQDEKGLYSSGYDTGISERLINATGKDANSSERNLYASANNQNNSERGIIVQGNEESQSERGIFSVGSNNDSSERILYATSKQAEQTERQLYITGFDQDTGEKSLYSVGSLEGESERGLYAKGIAIVSGERTLFIEGEGGTSSQRGLYAICETTDGSERGIYANGEIVTTSERGLYIEGLDVDSSERKLNASAEDSSSSERSLYAIAILRETSERGLYAIGFSSYTAELKRWNGTSWEQVTLKKYNGTSWETPVLKVYNGEWKIVKVSP